MTDPQIVKYIDQMCEKTGDIEVQNIRFDDQYTLIIPVFNGELGIKQTATLDMEFSYDGEEVTLHSFPRNLLSSEDYIYISEAIEEVMEVARDFMDLGNKYGFKISTRDNELRLSAKNTDNRWVTWLTYDSQKDTVTCHGNTDFLNIWLSDTRKDLTPEKCLSFVKELNATFPLIGENRIAVRQLIDPEDWQAIANVQDAYRDTRYAEADKENAKEEQQSETAAIISTSEMLAGISTLKQAGKGSCSFPVSEISEIYIEIWENDEPEISIEFRSSVSGMVYEAAVCAYDNDNDIESALDYMRMCALDSELDAFGKDIDVGKISDSARISVTWDSYGIAVDFNYSYSEADGYGESVLCFCEPYADGSPDQLIWEEAKQIGNLLKSKYNLPLDISKDTAFLATVVSRRSALDAQIQSASVRAAEPQTPFEGSRTKHEPER